MPSTLHPTGVEWDYVPIARDGALRKPALTIDSAMRLHYRKGFATADETMTMERRQTSVTPGGRTTEPFLARSMPADGASKCLNRRLHTDPSQRSQGRR